MKARADVPETCGGFLYATLVPHYARLAVGKRIPWCSQPPDEHSSLRNVIPNYKYLDIAQTHTQTTNNNVCIYIYKYNYIRIKHMHIYKYICNKSKNVYKYK